DQFLSEHVFEPLGMVDTAFFVPAEKVGRLAAVYGRQDGQLTEITPAIGQASFTSRPAFLSGAGGLVSTAADYQRFIDMLAGKGSVDGVRLLGRKTVEYMTVNHLPGGRLMNEMGQSTFSEVTMDGTGFGL